MAKKTSVKRKNLKTKISNVYMAVTLLFIFAFSFCLTSKFYIADEIDILNTEIGKEFTITSNGKFSINDWIYDEKNNKMQVTLITSNMSSYLSELNFQSVSRINVKKELETEVVYSSNDIYIIEIKDVPKNFEQVALRLIKHDVSFEEEFEQNKKQEKEEEDSIITSIYADQREVKKGNIVETDIKEYAVKVTDEMIEESKTEIEKIRENIEGIVKMNEHINQEIDKLKQELIYQTLEEQNATNNEIYRMEKEIETNNKEVKNYELDVQSYESKIKRLEQRKRDLNF